MGLSVYSLAKCLHWIRSFINEALNHHGNLPCCPFHGKPGITCSSHPIVRIWQAWFANLLACNLTARVYRKTTPVRFVLSSGMGNPRFRNLCLMGFVCILHAQNRMFVSAEDTPLSWLLYACLQDTAVQGKHQITKHSSFPRNWLLSS